MEPGDIDARVSALEGEVRDLSRRVRGSEHDAAAARILAGAADRGVSEFGTELRELRVEVQQFRRATTASLNAGRQDFVDLRVHRDQRFAGMDERFDQGFMEMRGRLDGAAAGQQQIVDLLAGLIADGNDGAS